ncbi:MAG: hydrolase 1, exosortase A system-associated [Tardiphaga sp.]|uniref:hydrolase 1, exosortase A system-associated n=1 Tax=Tardiphaga sp. TaxID=1926292 RepID=UPI001999E202|nr:hydrolase 1, exosortase A system-associated [Tardiphaga sp.]MBC7584823.1 hydrolase 1, exosortase A system-associated [Tardiphaga sp.]
MMVEQRATSFQCGENWLYGILSLPQSAGAAADAGRRGVLVVVGGPQYRVGSHRQFALLAHALAAQQIPVMRFDYRGMGDSEGAARSFEEVDDDVRAALDAFCAAVPGMSEVVIWGLCDAASAALFYAHQDRRVTGLVLLNPWVRTEAGMAKAYLKHYYLSRLMAPELWRKIFTGGFQFGAALRSFLSLAGAAVRPRQDAAAPVVNASLAPAQRAASLPDRMLDGLERFQGRVLIILSGNDLTAQEFSDVAGASARWRRRLQAPGVQQHALPAANHTFSQREWRDQVAGWTAQWTKSW